MSKPPLLACVEPDLAPIKAQLVALSAKYRDGGEDRIGWEILQSIRALDEATHLAGVYLSGKPLPTLAEMRGIGENGTGYAVPDQRCTLCMGKGWRHIRRLRNCGALEQVVCCDCDGTGRRPARHTAEVTDGSAKTKDV